MKQDEVHTHSKGMIHVLVRTKCYYGISFCYLKWYATQSIVVIPGISRSIFSSYNWSWVTETLESKWSREGGTIRSSINSIN